MGKARIIPTFPVLPPENRTWDGAADAILADLKKADHDAVNHPKHYTSSPAKCECGRPIECIQITRHMGFNPGNAVKYVWRADLKNDAIEDLEKAVWYLQDEIAERKRKAAA